MIVTALLLMACTSSAPDPADQGASKWNLAATLEARAAPTNPDRTNQSSYINITDLKEGEEPEEGQWIYQELDAQGIYARVIGMFTPSDRMMTLYMCTTLKQKDTTNPAVQVRYPNPLPLELINQEGSLPIQTTVDGKTVPVEWHPALTLDTIIKLPSPHAQMLVQYIQETNADSYQIVFPNHPQLNRTIPTAGLGTAVADTGLTCFTNAIQDQDTQLLMPPTTPQEPRDGNYNYTSPDQRFTFQYPADCGQMWETPTNADNNPTCTGNPNEINTFLEMVNFQGFGDQLHDSPEQMTKGYADDIAHRHDGTNRYHLITDAGHRLEVAHIELHDGNGPPTMLTAHFADSQWHLISIYFSYWPDTSDINDQRAEDALKTFAAKHP